jgi:Cu2+-containing amine oxidase
LVGSEEICPYLFDQIPLDDSCSYSLINLSTDSIIAKRAQFAQHHVWVTKYKDGELWAGGEFTNQSQKEVDGVADAVARNENVENDDVVVWNVFGLTVSEIPDTLQHVTD